MKTGLTIQQMAQELLRQSKAKQDYLVNTGSLSLSVTSDAPQLRVTENGLDKITPLDIRQTAHRQLGTYLGIPQKYYELMRTDAPELLAYNANYWFSQKNELRTLRTMDGCARAFLSNRYYAMPSDTPGISDATPDIFERIGKIESIINEDIGERNCRFHFMLHEFEGILFSEPNTFHLIANDGIVGEIQRIRNDFETPEHINNSPETAPSKRLETLIPGYAKVKNGTQLSEAMGLGAIMAQCPHFKKWIEDMVAW